VSDYVVHATSPFRANQELLDGPVGNRQGHLYVSISLVSPLCDEVDLQLSDLSDHRLETLDPLDLVNEELH
jgi:hypothetical protein